MLTLVITEPLGAPTSLEELLAALLADPPTDDPPTDDAESNDTGSIHHLPSDLW